MKLSATILALAAATASASVPSLTPDNYDSLTDGKTVFIKFFAPWCGHCKKMAPDWEKLSSEFEGHEVGLIAEVDCTTEGKPLCDANGVKGFPTLKYGDPSALEDYSGGRTYDALATFAKENLKPVCSPAKLDLCDDDKKKAIEELMAKSEEELAASISEEEKKLEAAEEEFKAAVENLQKTYQSLMDDKDAKLAAVKDAGLGLMKSVAGYKKKAVASDEL
jgi:protein disulfide-isomerase-like protein